MNEQLTEAQTTTLDRAATLLVVATITIGVAGDKIAGLRDDLDIADLLASIRQHLASLGETANRLTDILREHGYKVQP
jgi:hypothetical protein